MTPMHGAVLAAGYLTWIAFTVCMRYYFRKRRQANAAKNWLVRCASACTVGHLVALALVTPPTPLLSWAGVACFAVANGLYWWALLAHGKDRPAFAFARVTPPAFTERGPYRRVRHPIYTAYLVAWLAGAVATGLPWLLLTVLGMGLLYYRAARLEEELFLASPVADDYRQYRRRTGMFVPRLTPGNVQDRGKAA
jgi:protein-S-isoprenylcysteine O-methyltransferase Ste14